MWTTPGGVYKIETQTSAPRLAGINPPLFATGTVTTSGSLTAWLPTNNAISYRVVVGRYDATGQYLLLSAPTAPIVTYNTSGSNQLISLTVYLDPEITSGSDGYFLQLYRSAPQDQTIATNPSDELFQSYEYVITNTDVTNGYAVIIDPNASSDSSRPLYTNAATGSGIATSNDQPPNSRAIAPFRDFMFYANTNTYQSLDVELLGTGSPAGLQSGDVVTINGVQFTGGASNVINTRTFSVATSGTASQNIQNTVLNLATVVNGYWNPGNSSLFTNGLPLPDYTQRIVAQYTSGYGDPPGKLSFRTVSYDQAQFSFNGGTHANTCWSPQNTAGLTSDNTRQYAALFWSNEGLPETAPLDNMAIVR